MTDTTNPTKTCPKGTAWCTIPNAIHVACDVAVPARPRISSTGDLGTGLARYHYQVIRDARTVVSADVVALDEVFTLVGRDADAILAHPQAPVLHWNHFIDDDPVTVGFDGEGAFVESEHGIARLGVGDAIVIHHQGQTHAEYRASKGY